MSILFCTPCYGGAAHEAHMRSTLELRGELTRQGVYHDWLTGRNESLITRARNEMTATYLKTDFQSMMWIDADIDFEAADVIRLANLDVDIAVAFYKMKKIDQPPLSAWRNGKLVDLAECPSDPFEVDYAGTGFFMIKRHVIETLAKTSQSYMGANGRVPALYMTPIEDDCLLSEDYFFCKRAREAGFKIIGDPSIKLGHWGQFRFA